MHVIHSLLKGGCKALDDLGIFIEKAGFGAVRGVGDVSGIYAKRGNHIASPFFLKGGSGRLEFHCESSRSITCKSRRCGTKVNALVDFQICCRVNAVVFQNIFKNHFWHAACHHYYYVNNHPIVVSQWFLVINPADSLW